MKRLGLLLSVAGGLVVAGCGDDDRSSSREDAGDTRIDGGRRDSGGIILMDSGRGEMDAGMTPMGACADPLMPFPMEGLPRCAAATRDCVNACTTAACVEGCLRMDM